MTTKLPDRRGYFDSADGLRLYGEHDPVDNPRARLLHVHGFAEHCGRYRDMHARFTAAGFSCHRFDVRGHGNSAGRRGHVYAFDEFIQDLDAFCARVDEIEPNDAPRILISHSNGGLIAAHALMRDASRFDAAVFSSPFIGFALKVPAWKALIAKALSRYIPAISLSTDIPAEYVSRDPATRDEYATDPLIGKVASARWLTETEKAQAEALAGASGIVLPVLIQQAGSDKVVDPEAARAFFEALSSEDKTFQAYPELFHEIWFEIERDRVYADLEAWLDTRYPAKG